MGRFDVTTGEIESTWLDKIFYDPEIELRWKKRGVFALAFVGVALVVMTFVLASNLGRSPDPSIIVPDYGLDEVVCVPHDSGE